MTETLDLRELSLDGAATAVGAASYTRPLDQKALRRLVARRRYKVMKMVARRLVRRGQPRESLVNDIYETLYASENDAYAASRDKRRDVFFVRGKPVYTDGWFTIKAHHELLLRALRRVAATSVLEVGSGRGVNLALLALRLSDVRLAGLELTQSGVERSEELKASLPDQFFGVAEVRSEDADPGVLTRLEFVRSDARAMPFEDNEFDCSFTCLVLEQIPHDFPQVVREMARVTRRYCLFIEPFAEANGPLGRAYLRSLDYFRARAQDFAQFGLEPVLFTADIPQKVHFGTGFLVAKVV